MALSSLSKLIIMIDENNIDIRLVASLGSQVTRSYPAMIELCFLAQSNGLRSFYSYKVQKEKKNILPST